MEVERMVREFYFDKDKDWKEQLDKLESEGWRVRGREPIEEIRARLLGTRCFLERRRKK